MRSESHSRPSLPVFEVASQPTRLAFSSARAQLQRALRRYELGLLLASGVAVGLALWAGTSWLLEAWQLR